MALITFLDAQLAYGHHPLLDHTDFVLETGERIGLIGRNGAGKSSLLKILAGLEKADDGVLQLQQGLRLAYVAQAPELDLQASVFDVASAALAGVRALIDQYSDGQGELDVLQSAIEAQGGWRWEQRVGETLQLLQLDSAAQVGTLSGGSKKRLALAQALVARPDVLLLDEPTNHLDLDSIQWLEELLLAFKGSVVTITHDRSFLDRVATRIVELDRGILRSYAGNFSRYQTLKEQQLAQEVVTSAKADRLLAQEEIWIRKGVEARRTRSQSRIVRLENLRASRKAHREAVGKVRMDVAAGMLSGKLVAELSAVSKSFGAQPIIKDFSATVLRGDKIGLIAPNGAGKTTLLKLILGELQPDQGRVRQGANLLVAYFDQLRDALDLNATLVDFISPGSEWIEIGRQRKHVKSYLGDFLFSPARANSPVSSLSGGERSRLLLARLFARPANVLVLDEPTNDLDIETLELLEELLQNYRGTVFLVSHDRTFLDNVVTSTIVFEGDGHWCEFEGGVSDWLLQSRRAREIAAASQAPTAKVRLPVDDDRSRTQPGKPASGGGVKKLGYKEQHELDALPEKIEALEQEQKELRLALADASLYARDPRRASELCQRDGPLEDEIMQALTRWEELAAAVDTRT